MNRHYVEQLISQNIRLVYYVVFKYYADLIKLVGKDDVVSVGKIGLVIAAQRYDPTRGTKFSTYAITVISQQIYKEIIQKEKRRKKKGDYKLVYLDGDSEDMEDKGFYEMIGQDDADLRATETRIFIETMLSKLPEKQRKAIELYFGLNGHQEHTQREIAPIIGVTQAQVNRLIKKGLKKMREEVGLT